MSLIERCRLTEEEKDALCHARGCVLPCGESCIGEASMVQEAQLAKALRGVVDWIPTQASKEHNLDKYQALLWLDYALMKELEADGLKGGSREH